MLHLGLSDFFIALGEESDRGANAHNEQTLVEELDGLGALLGAHEVEEGAWQDNSI